MSTERTAQETIERIHEFERHRAMIREHMQTVPPENVRACIFMSSSATSDPTKIAVNGGVAGEPAEVVAIMRRFFRHLLTVEPAVAAMVYIEFKKLVDEQVRISLDQLATGIANRVKGH